MDRQSYRLRYPYSKCWLILWMILFLPIGLVLLSRLQFTSEQQITSWEYQGNRFWLYFWAIFFFPITILLLLLKGALIISRD